MATQTPPAAAAPPGGPHHHDDSSSSSSLVARGPLITTSVEAGAAAQQVLQVVDQLDFKWAGPGLTAGAEAVPLPSPQHTVLFRPPPAAAAPAAAAAAAVDDHGAGSGSRGPPISAGGLTAAVAAPSQPRAPGLAPPDAAASIAMRPLPLKQLHAGGARLAGSPTPRSPATHAAASAPEQGGSSSSMSWPARAHAAVSGAWQRLLQEAAWAACTLARLLLWLLVAPVRAVLGPWYRYNRALKQRSLAQLSQPFDLARLQELLGGLPSWLSGIGGATEDLAWLNTALAELWPVLDPVVCELVRTTVEPLLADMKPPFIARLGFQRLTLGELPVVLEGLRLVGSNDGADVAGEAPIEAAAAAARAAQAAATCDDRIELEVDFRWVGQPNISFFVELALAGPYTRLVPKVSNINAVGTLRIGLTRLVPQLPGFGALMVSLARNPQIKFTLDFGPALGGKVTAKPVAAFLDPFLRDTLASLLVWPNRFVLPLLPRSVTGNLDSLALHSVGVLEVEVLAAHGLPKKGGMLSTVDPQVELWTQPQHRVHTTVKRNRRSPNWKGQRLEVLVQEPDSQLLRVVVQDIDSLNISELLTLNVVRGATGLLRSANPIGHATLPLRELCRAPGSRQEVELRLAGSEWAYELGMTGEDEAGRLNLALTYKPFSDLPATGTTSTTTGATTTTASSGSGFAPSASASPLATSPSSPSEQQQQPEGLIECRGVLFVDVRQCQELPAGDWSSQGGGGCDPYVLLKVAGQKGQTVVMPHSTSPVFSSHFEFFNITLPDVLEVEVWDRDYLKPDDLLGRASLPVKGIVGATQGGVRGVRDGWWRLRPKGARGWEGPGAGRIEMKVQFRPYRS